MSFAEIDETEAAYFRGGGFAPYVMNTEIVTDDYASALPAALRSPFKGPQLSNSQLPESLRSPSRESPRPNVTSSSSSSSYNSSAINKNGFSSSSAPTTFGLRSSNNANVMTMQMNQNQENIHHGVTPILPQQQHKGSVARKLPVRAGSQQRQERRVVSFSDDENNIGESTPPPPTAHQTPSAIPSALKSTATQQNQQYYQGGGNNNQNNQNNNNNTFMMGFAGGASGWSTSSVTSTPMNQSQLNFQNNKNNNNNNNLGDTETKVRELMMKRQNGEMINNYNDRAMDHAVAPKITSASSPFISSLFRNQQQQKAEIMRSNITASSNFGDENENDGNTVEAQSRNGMSMNDFTGLNKPSFLSGMFSSLKKTQLQPQFNITDHLDEDERPPSSLTPRPAPPSVPPPSQQPIVIQSAEKSQSSGRFLSGKNQNSINNNGMVAPKAVLPSLNFAEYEDEEEQMAPRLPPGLTPSTASKNSSTGKSSSSDSPDHHDDERNSDDDDDFSPRNPKIRPPTELFNEIRMKDAQGRLDKDGNLNEASQERRDQSIESALGIKHSAPASGMKPIFGRQPSSSVPRRDNSSPVSRQSHQQQQQNDLRQLPVSIAKKNPILSGATQFSNRSSKPNFEEDDQDEDFRDDFKVTKEQQSKPELSLSPNGNTKFGGGAATTTSTYTLKQPTFTSPTATPLTNRNQQQQQPSSTNFDEIDDSPPGVSFSEFLPASPPPQKNNANNKNGNEENDDDDYSPIKSALYQDPFLEKKSNKNQLLHDSPAMDRLRFGYAAASTLLTSPSGNSKSVTFHHANLAISPDEEERNNNKNKKPISSVKQPQQQQQHYSPTPIAYQSHYYDPTSNFSASRTAINNNTKSDDDFVPKAAIPIASLVSAGRDSSPASSMDAVLGQRTASATKKERQEQQQQQQQQHQAATTPQGGLRPPTAAPKRRFGTALDLLQSNMSLHGEDDKDLRSFVRNLKNAETGKPVEQLSMSPERTNRNAFDLTTSTTHVADSLHEVEQNENEDIGDLPPPSAFALEMRKILNSSNHHNHQEEHLQTQGFASSPNAKKVEPAKSTTSASVVGVRVAMTTLQIPNADFDYQVGITPQSRQLQDWQVDGAARGVPAGVQIFNHPSISPSYRQRRGEAGEPQQQEEDTSSRRRRAAALEQLNRPLTSLQRKRVQLKFNSSETRETTIYVDQEKKQMERKNDDDDYDDENEDDMNEEFAPASHSRQTRSSSNKYNHHVLSSATSSSSVARVDAHKAYLALRSKQKSNSAFYAETGADVEISDNDLDDEDEDVNIHDVSVSNLAKKKQVTFSLSRNNREGRFGKEEDHLNTTTTIPNNHNHSSHISPSSSHRFTSPQQKQKQEERESVARKKAQIMEKILSGVSPMNKMSSSSTRAFDRREASPSGASVVSSSSQDSAMAQVRESGVLVEMDVDDLPADSESGWVWTTRRLLILGSISIGVIIVVVLVVIGFVVGL